MKPWIYGIIVIGVLLVGFLIYPKLFIEDSLSNNMKVESVFQNNEAMPIRFTCDGDNLSPELTISDIPDGTKTIAIICDDPDAPAGTWVHWVLWDIFSNEETLKLSENTQLGIKGKNDFGKLGYGGPCPPSGTHHYFFKVYALNSILELREGSTKEELERAMQGKVLGEGVLVGLYSRD